MQFQVKRALKAKMPEGISELTLSAFSQCWESTSRVPEELIGKNVRIFGFNPGPQRAWGIVNVVPLPLNGATADQLDQTAIGTDP